MDVGIEGAFALVKKLEDLNKVLMIRRTNRPYVNKLSFPGGVIEKINGIAETHKQTVKREVLEEVSIRCEPGMYLGYVNFPDDLDKKIRYTAHFYESLYLSGSPRPVDYEEVSEVLWVDQNEMPNIDTAYPVAKFYKKVLSGNELPLYLLL